MLHGQGAHDKVADGQICCMARARMTKSLTEAMAAASNPAKGGFVREALISTYPKLDAMLEATFERLQRETEVRLSVCCLSVCCLSVCLSVCHGIALSVCCSMNASVVHRSGAVLISAAPICPSRSRVWRRLRRRSSSSRWPPRRRRSKMRTWRRRCSACRTPCTLRSRGATARCRRLATCRSASREFAKNVQCNSLMLDNA
jgi:hypothetical protein